MRFNLGTRRSLNSQPEKTAPPTHQYHLRNPDADVMISAWECPVHAPAGASEEWFKRNCTLPLENVNFTLGSSPGAHAISGSDKLHVLHAGTTALQIAAAPTSYYATEPYLMCDIITPLPGDPETPAATIHCNWYTWQPTPGDVTVYAWDCPDGYDYTAASADPMADCTGIANRIPFRLRTNEPDQEQLAESDSFRTGSARFSDLKPGEYTLTERADMRDEHGSILWQCFGFHEEGMQPSLHVGPGISFVISGGEHILCHRFHIPPRAEAEAE